MRLTPEMRLPPVDGWSDAEVRERWKLARFPRLFAFCRESGSESACESRGLGAELTIGLGSDGEWRLEGRVQATLDATCQRCLEPLRLDVEGALDMALTGPAGAEETREWPPEGVTLGELLEDEIFLAMPRIPVHGDVSECGEFVRGLANVGSGESAVGGDGAGDTRPFAGLRDLLSRTDERDD